MREIIDGVTAYVVGFFMVLFSFAIDNASDVLKIGGILLLMIRLYADGVRAWQTWRGEL